MNLHGNERLAVNKLHCINNLNEDDNTSLESSCVTTAGEGKGMRDAIHRDFLYVAAAARQVTIRDSAVS